MTVEPTRHKTRIPLIRVDRFNNSPWLSKSAPDSATTTSPPSSARGADRLARFEREAKVLASLNHPNIGHIYGLEEAEGQKALVLELIEGPTLADRIKQGPIPVDEALPIAKQIAEALEAAHEQGVIHRDLKPANIKVRPDGTVKVLDFGLAKAMEGSGGDVSESPTVTAAATASGVILGTAAYMSPEQARGKPVDKRSDIWAFGAVLCEMLTEQRPFEGRDVSEVLGGVLRLDPDWDALPGDTPPHLTAYLKRCLEKEPRQRVHDIADVRLAMEGAFETVTTGRTETAIAQRGGWLPWSSGLALAVVSSLTVWTLTRPEPIPADVVQFTIAPTDTAPLNLVRGRQDLAFSPDGTQIVYTGAEPRLYLHRLDQLRSTPVRGGENGFGPFFSPDGSAVGFVDANQTTLQRVAVLEGSPVTVTESPNAIYGASWGADGQIIFGTNGAGLFRVPSGGGEPETLTTLDTGQGDTAHAWPFIIPGRDAVLFTIRFAVGFGSEQLAILELDTREVTRLGLAGVRPHYASTGHLVYATVEGWVRAMSFDASSLEVTGNSVPLVEGVAVHLTGAVNFSISDSGGLAYALGARPSDVRRSFVWVDRNGREETVAVSPGDYEDFTLSPDGTRVAVRVQGDDPRVAIYDLTRDINNRLTFESDNVGVESPTWTPDGTHVAFGAPLSWKRADGTGDLETLSDDPERFPQAFSLDGGTLVFADRLGDGGSGLGVLTLEDGISTPLLDEEFIERGATLSPDGRWLAYTSHETGRPEVYVRPFPNVATGQWQISIDVGGQGAQWNPVQDELFYLDPPDGVMVLEFEADPTFTPGRVARLFEREFSSARNRQMAVSPDGQRFLFLTDVTVDTGSEDAAPPQINVVLNWFQELTERVPIN